MLNAPWEVYAQQLLPAGYGHPLWVPEPTSGREIFIGDVGWLCDGGFCALFNSMKGADDPINQERNVPIDFAVFSYPKLSILRSAKIFSRLLSSRNVSVSNLVEEGPTDVPPSKAGKSTEDTEQKVNASDAQGEFPAVAPTPVPVSAGAGWRFQCKPGAGAMLMLNPPGVAEDIDSRRYIVNYMRDNFDSWLEFANASDSWGLELRSEDLLFICGTVKTTRWAVAVFQGTHNMDGYVSGQVDWIENVGFSFHISNQFLPTAHYRAGPRIPVAQVNPHRRSSPGHNTPADLTPSGLDQCLFIHYFKMKRRLLSRMPMKAAAGPHQLPPGADKPGPDAISPGGYQFETNAHGREDAYDPVNHLLDYILRASKADIAIASDLDLIMLFRDMTFPDDIPVALTELSPSVEVDEHGVGTISLDQTSAETDRDTDEEAYPYDEHTPQYPPVASYSPCPPKASSNIPSAPQDFPYPPQGSGRPPEFLSRGKQGSFKRGGDVDQRIVKPGEKVVGQQPDRSSQATIACSA